MIFPKPPMISYSQSENLRDSLVKAKLPSREENDYTYDDLVRNEEDPPSSPTLQTLQDLELESRGFNMFIDFEEIEDNQNRKSYSLQPETRSWRSFLKSDPSTYARKNIPDRYRH